MDEQHKLPLLSVAAKYGHVRVIDQLMCTCRHRCTHISTHRACYKAIQHDQFLFLTRIVERIGVESLANIGARMTRKMATYGRLNMLVWWVNQGGLISQGSVNAAVWYCQIDVLKWFLQNKYFPSSDSMIYPFISSYTTRKEHEALVILHKYKSPGYYKKDCVSGECIVCKLKRVSEEWEMEDGVYANVVQWIPLEVLNEVADFVAYT